MPAVPAAGVPAIVAVPSPLLTKVTPLGRAPVLVREAIGLPVVSTLKLPGMLTENVALAGLMKAGALFTTKTNVCEASGSTPLVAVILKE